MTAPAPPHRAAGRRGLRAVLLLAGGALTALLVAVSSVAVAGVLVRTSEREDTTLALAAPLRRVVVSVHGSATVRPGPDGQVRIERRSRFSFARPEVTREERDGVLTLRVRCEGVTVICDNHLDLTVPADVDLDLRVLHAIVHDTGGAVFARTGGGAIELDGVSGPVDVRVGGGAIFGRRLLSDDVRAESSAGAIELSFSRAPTSVDAQTGAGHVEVILPPGEEAYQVDARAGRGDTQVDVRADDASERTVRARAGTGGVVVRYGSG